MSRIYERIGSFFATKDRGEEKIMTIKQEDERIIDSFINSSKLEKFVKKYRDNESILNLYTVTDFIEKYIMEIKIVRSKTFLNFIVVLSYKFNSSAFHLPFIEMLCDFLGWISIWIKTDPKLIFNPMVKYDSKGTIRIQIG